MENGYTETTDSKENLEIQVYKNADGNKSSETIFVNDCNVEENLENILENSVDIFIELPENNSDQEVLNGEHETEQLLNNKSQEENDLEFRCSEKEADENYAFDKSEIVVVSTEDGDTESICIGGKNETPGCTCSSCCNKKKKEKNVKSDTAQKQQKKELKRLRARKRKKSCKSCCKKFVAFLFSHIGLTSCVVAYSILGGFIFRALESPYELLQRENVEKIRKSKIDSLWNITYVYNILYPINWTVETDKVLREFQKEIYKATKERGWDGGEEKEGGFKSQWSFAGSLLYSITVITTIGYGHIAPKTDYGMLVTIFYALFGIPLTLLCLANIGSFFGDCFRLFYKHVCLAVICLCCPSQAKWTSESKSKTSSKPFNIDNEKSPLTLRKNDKIEAGEKNDKEKGTLKVDDVEIKDKKDYVEVVRVPILVSLMLIALYIIAGAVLFSTWEGWNYLEGSYFCFITLSTVGFGDYVPGAGSDSLSNNEKLILCACYLFFGLAIIAMCFDLMQEEVRAKFRWLGQKIGIIDKRK
ncbi:hypothetical protein KUTeg_010222 [Tegillarca granosa]|uniref:Potassium channel domain-containing protein n=1 Tax=Tegillarca granosa TaxID=220873 RepID=A0ABQ9F643_TEGGR|nr:hypothetical protein KUTeg_010222 [Tegillarca granosa]